MCADAGNHRAHTCVREQLGVNFFQKCAARSAKPIIPTALIQRLMTKSNKLSRCFVLTHRANWPIAFPHFCDCVQMSERVRPRLELCPDSPSAFARP
jgi:hypothetical protein